MTEHLYIAHWDCLGFESIIDITEHNQQAIWAELKGEQPKRLQAVPLMVMRAKSNPQRFPEVWSFSSEIDLDTLISFSKESPQELADLIRQRGVKVYVTQKSNKVVIK